MDTIKHLIEQLESPVGETREKAAEKLGENRDGSAVPLLIDTLKHYNPETRVCAMEALVKYTEHGPVTPLVNALEHKNGYVRENAGEVLNFIGWTPENNKELALYLTARRDWDDLTNLGEDAVEPLITALEDTDPAVRYAAVEALGEIGDPMAVEPLKRVLRDKEARLRLLAVTALGNMGKETTAFLIGLLKDKRRKREFREEAARSLGNIGDKRAVKPLIGVLNDQHPNFSGAAAEALGKIGGEHAVEPLFDKMNKKGPGWKKAAMALGVIGDARAVEPLIKIEWQSREISVILEKIIKKIPTDDHDYFCEHCCCRAEKHKPKAKLFGLLILPTHFEYYACRKCHSDTYLTANIKTVILLLDRHMEEISLRNGDTLTINWFKRSELMKGKKDELFDYDEIHIENADEYEIEKCVLALWNDMDDHRRKRLREIPLHFAPHLELSPAKLNLLKDVFPRCR